jgi:hypothetical protein
METRRDFLMAAAASVAVATERYFKQSLDLARWLYR